MQTPCRAPRRCRRVGRRRGALRRAVDRIDCSFAAPTDSPRPLTRRSCATQAEGAAAAYKSIAADKEALEKKMRAAAAETAPTATAAASAASAEDDGELVRLRPQNEKLWRGRFHRMNAVRPPRGRRVRVTAARPTQERLREQNKKLSAERTAAEKDSEALKKQAEGLASE